ncbi:MalY/PatB family protein [Aerococcaceae bacterium WGS1372]
MTVEEFVSNYYVERKHTRSLKWDLLQERFGDPDLLPLWVADMDFKVSPAISQELAERVEHGVYGYSYADTAYYDILNQWLSRHFNFEIQADWVRFSTGVVQAIYYLIHAYTKKNDAVIIQTPVYYPFANAVRDSGRQLISVDLINHDGYFTMDYDHFEEAIIQHQVKLYLHCSPHNPVGRVWTEEESVGLFEICKKHDVLVISDEIHQDFTYDKQHIPSAVLNHGQYSDRIITLNSASKSFNLAGLTHCHIIISDPNLRKEYDHYAKTIVQTEINLMGLIATEAAFKNGQPWLDGLKEVILYNYQSVVESFEREVLEVIVSPLEGSYLVFIDLRKVLEPKNIESFIQDQCGIAVDYGEWFGENYKGFIRINLATKPENVKYALDNIIQNLT